MVLHPMRPVLYLLILFMTLSGLAQGELRPVTELAQSKTQAVSLAMLGSDVPTREADRSKSAPAFGSDDAACLPGVKHCAQRHMAGQQCDNAPRLGRRTGQCGSNPARAPPRFA